MSVTQTCLIEKNVFFREGVKALLSETAYQVVSTCENSDFVDGEEEGTLCKEAPLIIMGVENHPDAITEMVERVKEKCPNGKYVVLTNKADPQCVAAAFSAGVDGYLLRDISPKVLKVSLDMVMAGEKVCPSAIVSLFVSRTNDDGDIPAEGGNHNLSTREVQVLKYLASGGSNKQIARNLDITEATVKVHIKAVLRKLDLSNRTQAAVWAVNEGLANNSQARYG